MRLPHWLLCGTLLLAACAAPTAPSTLTPTAPVPTATPPPPTATFPPPTATPLPSIDPGRVFAPGQWHATVYHAGLGQVVLVNGGPETTRPSEDPLELWAWDGAAWRLINEAGPPWRNWAGVTYDEGRGVLVVYGGLQTRTRRFHELWEWDGAQWTQHEADGPGPREAAGLVYDAARKHVVLFGGAVGQTLVGDTWAWDGETWTLLSSEGPGARFPGAMAYDPGSQQILLYGGHVPNAANENVDRADLWAWNGSAWRELAQGAATPGLRVAAAMTYDPLVGRMLLYGGALEGDYHGDAWWWDGTGWEAQAESAPGPRAFAGLAFDAARQRMVLSSGHDRPMAPPLKDTWEWDGQWWVCVAGCVEGE